MTRQDLIIATIRTAVPAAIGKLLATLIASLPVFADAIATINLILGESVPGLTVEAILNAAGIGLVVAAYYWAARWVSARFPKLNLEAWLLGSAKTPTYTKEN